MKAKTTMMIVFLAFSVAVLSGCRYAPIKNVDYSAVRMSKSNYSVEDVGKAIMRAGSFSNWRMEQTAPGMIIATYSQFGEDYAASVSIAYNRSSYSIRYRNSTNLSNKSGEIHKNYNIWVQRLNEAIQRELWAA